MTCLSFKTSPNRSFCRLRMSSNIGSPKWNAVLELVRSLVHGIFSDHGTLLSLANTNLSLSLLVFWFLELFLLSPLFCVEELTHIWCIWSIVVFLSDSSWSYCWKVKFQFSMSGIFQLLFRWCSIQILGTKIMCSLSICHFPFTKFCYQIGPVFRRVLSSSRLSVSHFFDKHLEIPNLKHSLISQEDVYHL